MSFLNGALAGYLPWLFGLVSIPIIIHLLNRRRFKVVRWAAIEYLLQAERKNRRRVRLEHLIVLILRCLAVALVIAAIARPATTSGAFAAVPGARESLERVVVLDDSASMAHRGSERRAWDAALDSLRGLLKELEEKRPSDPLTVWRSSRGSPEVSRASGGSQAAQDLARRLSTWKEPSDVRFAAGEVLKRALSRPPEREHERRAVYILTDLRRCDWAESDGRLSKDVRDVLEKAGKETQVFVVDAGGDDTQNVGVVAFAPQERLVSAGIGQKLVATVHNYGAAAASNVPIRFGVVGGDSLPQAPIAEIPPGGEKRVEIGYTFADAGHFAVRVELENDRFDRDDARSLALEVVKAVRVLIVDGKPSDEMFEGAADFVWRALSPPGEVRSGVEPLVIPPERLGEEDLSSHHAVIACDLERWPQSRLAALERFVREGGGLALFVGDTVDAGAWEKDLWKDGQGLLPCRPGDLLGGARNEEPVKLGSADLDHPLLRFFQGDQNPFLKKIRSKKRFALKVDAKKDATSKVIARYDDPERTPAIVEKPYGEGRVFLFNTTANRAWTDWPVTPLGSFAITCQELVRLLAPQATAGRVVSVGEPIVRAINPALFEPRARIFVPGEDAPRELSAAPREGSDALWFSFDGSNTTRAGVYKLELVPRTGGAQVEPFAVVLDPRESDLARSRPEELVREPLENVELHFAKARKDGADTSLLSLTEGDVRELWRTCAILLLVILALESFLAWRAAHHESAAPADISPQEVAA